MTWEQSLARSQSMVQSFTDHTDSSIQKFAWCYLQEHNFSCKERTVVTHLQIGIQTSTCNVS